MIPVVTQLVKRTFTAVTIAVLVAAPHAVNAADWSYSATYSTLSDGEWTLAATAKSTVGTNGTYLALTIGKPSVYAASGILDFTKAVTGLDDPSKPCVFTGIANSAFYEVTQVKEFHFPATINSIGTYAFYKCSGFTAFTGIRNSAILTLQRFAFNGLDASLTSLTWDDFLPLGMTTIQERVFAGAILAGTELVFPALKSIGADVPVFSSAVIVRAEFQTGEAMSFTGYLLAQTCQNIVFHAANFTKTTTGNFYAMTNLTFQTGVPDTGHLDNIIHKVAAEADGVCPLRINSDAAESGWWHLAQTFTADEITAGEIPVDCFGVYRTTAGDRKGWLVANDGLAGILVETDMTKIGSAPSEARRFLQGESPCRVRTSHPLVPSVGTVEEESHPNDIV